MELTSGLVSAHADGPIGWLVWDNQAKLNALSPGMSEDALTVIEAYAADPAIKVVIMRGAGTRAFISGGDIKSFEQTRFDPEAAARGRAIPGKLKAAMLGMEKPLIAMIHGYCLGGGLGMLAVQALLSSPDSCLYAAARDVAGELRRVLAALEDPAVPCRG